MAGIKIIFDSERMRRAVINVIDNACQSMVTNVHRGTENKTKTLIIKTRKTLQRIEIIFCDTGCGIAKDKIDRIFEPLYSTKGFGVGLGMSTLEKIMQQHKGGIEIESKINVGTNVTLWLPQSFSLKLVSENHE